MLCPHTTLTRSGINEDLRTANFASFTPCCVLRALIVVAHSSNSQQQQQQHHHQQRQTVIMNKLTQQSVWTLILFRDGRGELLCGWPAPHCPECYQPLLCNSILMMHLPCCLLWQLLHCTTSHRWQCGARMCAATTKNASKQQCRVCDWVNEA